MKLRGRIIVYGEYLMHATTRGLIVPSHLTLSTAGEVGESPHPDYRSSLDSVAEALSARGLRVEQQVRGDLPFGCGLASSTVLALIHAHGQLPFSELLALVQMTDHGIHGFVPSGVDAASILHQSTGFFQAGDGWEATTLSTLRYTLLLFPPEGKRTRPEIKEQITSAAGALRQLADRLTEGVRADGAVDYGLLYDYSQLLLERGVYSPPVEAFVRDMLAIGLATKATGGLYDTAVLVVWPGSAGPTPAHRSVIERHLPLRVYDNFS